MNIELQYVVPKSTKSKFSKQFDWFNIALKTDFRLRWNLSTKLLDSGWQAVVRICLLLKSFINSQNKLYSNWQPHIRGNDSWNTETGQPAMNVFTVLWTSILAIGRTLHQREKRSTHVNKYVYPSQAGKGPEMFMCTCSNRSSGDGKWSTGVRVYLPILALWHCSQVLAYSRIFDFKRGQTYFSVSSLMEALARGWDKLWKRKKKIRQNDSGTNGRIFPVLTSHTMFRLLFGTRNFVKFRELFRSSFWRSWSFSCSSTNSTVSVHGSLKIAFIVLDIVSAGIFSTPFRCLISEVNCNK